MSKEIDNLINLIESSLHDEPSTVSRSRKKTKGSEFEELDEISAEIKQLEERIAELKSKRSKIRAKIRAKEIKASNKNKPKPKGMWGRFAAAKGWETDVEKADAQYKNSNASLIDWNKRKADNERIKQYMQATGLKGNLEDIKNNLEMNGKFDAVVNNTDKIISDIKNSDNWGPNHALDKYKGWGQNTWYH